MMSYTDGKGIKRQAWEIEAEDVRFLQRPSNGGTNSADGEAVAAIDTPGLFLLALERMLCVAQKQRKG